MIIILLREMERFRGKNHLFVIYLLLLLGILGNEDDCKEQY